MNVILFLSGLVLGLFGGMILTVYVEISLEEEKRKNECK